MGKMVLAPMQYLEWPLHVLIYNRLLVGTPGAGAVLEGLR